MSHNSAGTWIVRWEIRFDCPLKTAVLTSECLLRQFHFYICILSRLSAVTYKWTWRNLLYTPLLIECIANVMYQDRSVYSVLTILVMVGVSSRNLGSNYKVGKCLWIMGDGSIGEWEMCKECWSEGTGGWHLADSGQLWGCGLAGMWRIRGKEPLPAHVSLVYSHLYLYSFCRSAFGTPHREQTK